MQGLGIYLTALASLLALWSTHKMRSVGEGLEALSQLRLELRFNSYLAIENYCHSEPKQDRGCSLELQIINHHAWAPVDCKSNLPKTRSLKRHFKLRLDCTKSFGNWPAAKEWLSTEYQFMA